ncbi:hypothetical protein QBC34DRAFT_442857 [Podospora aff. communis PSN243]|uniref:Uncharacterized protein n=1 Tax=Podospora aff. communis PSN243 TaxID=3040156 RepID=A0AAV9G8X6_9PEZI|nr:hypothetical protein QBC34DRAFT_442857 [Podospora aff. communis PSN243]
MGPGYGTKDYKPVALRWPLLVPFIVYVAALVAIVEVVGRTFPSSDDIRENDGAAGSFQTALFTAPLINARAPAPVATPTPAPTVMPRRLSAKAHRHLFRRAENGSLPGILAETASDSLEVSAGASTESPPESSTASPTEAPPQSSAEAPPAPSEEIPAETPTESPTESSSESPANTPSQAASEVPSGAPSQTPSESPSQTPNESPSETPTFENPRGPYDVPDSHQPFPSGYTRASPFDKTPQLTGPDPLVGYANITELQLARIAQFDENGNPIPFGDRVASPPVASYLNSTTPGGNSSYIGPSRFRKRHHDPSAYAQYSGPTQIIQPIINIFYDTDNVPYEGGSWINYAGGDPENPDLFEACWATCNGPAIIYHSRSCWEEWVWKAALEEEARKANPDLAWKVVDDAYNGGVICMGQAVFGPGGGGGGGSDGGSGGGSGSGSGDQRSGGGTQRSGGGGGGGGNGDRGSPSPGGSGDGSSPGAGNGGSSPEGNAVPQLKTIVLTDANGVPTLTVTRLEATAGPLLTTITLRDASGVPTATITAAPSGKTSLLTLSDFAGRPTATVTIPPLVETLRDELGIPTATLTLNRPPKPTTLTLTNSDGVPTLTVTITPTFTPSRGPPTTAPKRPGFHPSSQLHLITPLEYALALFLPVLLATPLCIVAQIINSSIRTYLPFHTMMTDGGVPSAYSMTMPLDGVAGILTGLNILWKYHDPVAVLADLLTLLSAVIAALSSEAVGVQLYGGCEEDSFRGCFMGIAVFRGPNRALGVLLGVALGVLVGLAVVLARWRTGLRGVDAKRVRSLGVTAGLLGHGVTRGVLRGVMVRGEGEEGRGEGRIDTGEGRIGKGEEMRIGKGEEGRISKGEAERRLKGWTFGIGWYLAKEEEEYGILAIRNGERLGGRGEVVVKGERGSWVGRGWLRQPTTSWASLGGLGLLCGLFGLILYYETSKKHTAFENFMLGQKFGSRVLFTALGVVISLFWDGYYATISMMEVYRQISNGTQSPAQAAMVSPPVVAYTGIVDSIKRREWFVTVVAANTIIANFSPIVLANVPFNPSQTYTTHLVCVWMMVAFLAVMIMTLLYAAMFVGHPKMAMDPATLAGRIYHVFELGLLDGREKDVDETSLGGTEYGPWKAASFFGDEKAGMVWRERNRG